MKRCKRMLCFMFVLIVTGVNALDVHIDTEKKIQITGNNDVDCRLPYFPGSPVGTSHLHVKTPVRSEERVWIGWQRNFTKWMDFRGCTDGSGLLQLKNKDFDASDPFLDCYTFCKSFSFMLSSKTCFCSNESRSIQKLTPPMIVNSSLVGKRDNVLCIYQHLTNYLDKFIESPDGNCIFVIKTNSTIKFSNDLCSNNKTPLCVTFSTKEMHQQINSANMWLNASKVCEKRGTILSSYSMVSEIKNRKFMDDKQYWIAAFRRPLEPCLSAILYTNGTIGNPITTSCNTELRSLCIQDIEDMPNTENTDGIPDYFWGIVASICVVCVLIVILIYLYVRKVSRIKKGNVERKNRLSSQGTVGSSTETQTLRHDNAMNIGEIQENEYHTIGVPCRSSCASEGIYHELHEKHQESSNCNHYDHVSHGMITDNSHYDVFNKKGQSFNSVLSDYDTTFNTRKQLEGDYDSAGVKKIGPNLNDYDTVERQEIGEAINTSGSSSANV